MSEMLFMCGNIAFYADGTLTDASMRMWAWRWNEETCKIQYKSWSMSTKGNPEWVNLSGSSSCEDAYQQYLAKLVVND